MNDRIKALAEQVGGEIYIGYAGSSDFFKFTEEELKKFAELIINECAEVAGCNGHVSGFILGDLIKEHFGVEE